MEILILIVISNKYVTSISEKVHHALVVYDDNAKMQTPR